MWPFTIVATDLPLCSFYIFAMSKFAQLPYDMRNYVDLRGINNVLLDLHILYVVLSFIK